MEKCTIVADWIMRAPKANMIRMTILQLRRNEDIMKKNRVAIIGFGNIGRSVLEAINSSSDFELAGIVDVYKPDNLSNIEIVSDISRLTDVHVAIIAAPSKLVPDIAADLLAKGICCVDGYDIHNTIYEYKMRMQDIACKHDVVSVIAAGWDPGTDSMVRTLMLAMAPKGLTYTNFGPGISMGHSVCARGKEGVKDALSMTMPKGEGIHRRMVYVELEDGADIEAVTANIKMDPYFINDETQVTVVDSVSKLRDMGHGVTINRKGASGLTYNQLFSFDMRINNPALTGQILVSAARAALKQKPGAYTMIELPLIDLIEGDLETLIRTLV